jgi:hypothetical protein
VYLIRYWACSQVSFSLYHHLHTWSLSRGRDNPGILAYHLHENNPRSRPPSGHTLRELTSWQWARMQHARRERQRAEERREWAIGERAEEEEQELQRIRIELGLGGKGEQVGEQ